MQYIRFDNFKDLKKKQCTEIDYERYDTIGIDDFAFKKKQSYGTVFIDHLTNTIINIIDSRIQEDVTNELKKFVNLKICTRDGAPLYRGAISNANESVIQISDRFHLLKNCIEATIDDLKKLADKHIVLGDVTYDLSWIEVDLSPEQRSIIERNRKKQETIDRIRYDYTVNHLSKTELVRKYKLVFKTITRYLTKDAIIPRRNNRTEMHEYSDTIYSCLLEYKNKNIPINYRAIHTYIAELGYKGTYENFFKQLRLRIICNDLQSSLTVTRKEFNRLIYGFPIDSLKRSEEVKELLAEYLTQDNPYSKALRFVSEFKDIICNRSDTPIETFLKSFADGDNSEWIKLSAFMHGVERDIDAVKNQIEYTVTNGTTEGLVSKIKTIKKRTYGRASFSLLKSLIFLCNPTC